MAAQRARRDYGSGSVEERAPGRWRVQVEMGRDPVTGQRRRRRLTITGSRRDAQRALREALGERDHGVTVAPERLLVGEWLRGWLERHRAAADLSDRTYVRYRHIVEKQILPVLGDVRLNRLTPVHISTMYVKQLASLSANTVRQHHVVIKSALDEAVRSNLISTNPVAGVRRPTARLTVERRSLDEHEIAVLIAGARGRRVAAPIRFALATGIREGEILGLSWDDVDFDAAVVTVTRSAGRVVGEGVKLGRTKTRNARRSIELSPATLVLLRQHRNDQRQQRLRAGAAWQEHGLVFPSSVGTIWSPDNFYRDYRKVVAASGVTDPGTVNFHTLRHTAATQWLRAGADIHESPRV